MRNDKNAALRLRKEGLSYRQIEEKLSVPKSTLSNWLASHDWSKNIKATLVDINLKKSKIHIENLNKFRAEALKSMYKKAEQEAQLDYEKLKYHPLFIAGLMLYWGEGDKSVNSSHVRLGNVDSELLRVFLKFVHDLCGIRKEKIWASVHTYRDLDEKKCLEYWSKQTGINSNRFHKSQILKGRHKTKRLPYGTCTVGISSTYYKKKMLCWIEALSKDLLCDTYYQ